MNWIERGTYIVVIAYYMCKKAYDEGFTEGCAEAHAEINKQMTAYYKRMKEARARGEDFNEPPPMFNEERD